jgi:hypothetical protein
MSDFGARISGLVYREIGDSDGPSRIGYSAHWREDNDNPAPVSFLTFPESAIRLLLLEQRGALSGTPDPSP